MKKQSRLGILECCDGYQHLCIEVSDIEETWKICKEHAIRPDTEIKLGPDFSRQFWITDPDGNRIELMEYTEKAWQLRRENSNIETKEIKAEQDRGTVSAMLMTGEF